MSHKERYDNLVVLARRALNFLSSENEVMVISFSKQHEQDVFLSNDTKSNDTKSNYTNSYCVAHRSDGAFFECFRAARKDDPKTL